MKTTGFIFQQGASKVNLCLLRCLPLVAAALVVAGCSRTQVDPVDSETAAATPSAADAATATDSAAATPTVAAEDFALTCDNPVKLGTNLSAVRAAFGKDATIESKEGAEGEPYKALVLWAGDPTRRLEVPYDEEVKDPVVDTVEVSSAKSRWRAQGLVPGDPLAKVVAANGGPVSVSGFGWDYGGNITGWKGGKLSKLGDCAIYVQLTPGKDAKDGYAEGEEDFSSSDPRMVKAKAVIDSLRMVRAK